MDLEEYLFYKKKNDTNFTEKEFAKRIGVTQHQIWNIKKGRKAPSSKVAYLLEIHTNNEVDVMEMIRDFYRK